MSSAEAFYASIRAEVDAIREAGLYKRERIIATPQGATIRTADGREVINLCANNYLGLSSHPKVMEAAHEALRTHGYGLSSVRFICGTQDLHKELEGRLARFLGTEDTILYGSAFDANGGLFETLLGPEDAVISDELNHASIIDGIRLSKARRYRYKHNDLGDLRAQLKQADADGARFKLVFSDGVFSMDGTVARLDEIRKICDEHGALLGIDECHATGFMGQLGRGTHEARG
ncbi:MAG: aminotransferase class I/II-fold pyridoxal phosphate-dependent enzyme, partial [Cupriavidus sp.]|nr:aminotransferase class I/II-fold pyridoxal phosphate-dependent enzyme [Cupriavidus sp.]